VLNLCDQSLHKVTVSLERLCWLSANFLGTWSANCKHRRAVSVHFAEGHLRADPARWTFAGLVRELQPHDQRMQTGRFMWGVVFAVGFLPAWIEQPREEQDHEKPKVEHSNMGLLIRSRAALTDSSRLRKTFKSQACAKRDCSARVCKMTESQ
jgi:hypothetical protein